MDEGYCLITSAVDTRQAACELADWLVRERLAACVQVISAASVYRWEGEMVKADEFLLLIKTLKRHYAQIEQALVERHPYELPEILRLPVEGGYAPYLAWITGCVQ